jgi:hypothetical protein
MLPRTAPISELRHAIYESLGIAHLSGSRRSRRLRKVCRLAQGLDLRRKTDVVYLAVQLGLVIDEVSTIAAESQEFRFFARQEETVRFLLRCPEYCDRVYWCPHLQEVVVVVSDPRFLKLFSVAIQGEFRLAIAQQSVKS